MIRMILKNSVDGKICGSLVGFAWVDHIDPSVFRVRWLQLKEQEAEAEVKAVQRVPAGCRGASWRKPGKATGDIWDDLMMKYDDIS